jgi:hypothetical protein
MKNDLSMLTGLAMLPLFGQRIIYSVQKIHTVSEVGLGAFLDNSWDCDKLRSMGFFHLFFPSWRLFENTGDFPSVSFRFGSDKDSFCEWRPPFELQRKWTHIFYNPQGNLVHLLTTQASQILLQLEVAEKAKSIESMDAFIALKNFFYSQTPAQNSFQFKISVTSWQGNFRKNDDVVLSPVYQKTQGSESPR